jgi:exosome complex component RRP43
MDSLCIAPGKAVWVLYIDIICLNYDGNILDASMMALKAALKEGTLSDIFFKLLKVKIPQVLFDESTGTVKAVEGNFKKSTTLFKSLPKCISFGIMNGYVF